MTIEEKRASLESTINCLIWDISSTIQDLDEEFTNLTNLGHSERYINIDELIKKMKLEGIYTSELEDFIEKYLKFYNN